MLIGNGGSMSRSYWHTPIRGWCGNGGCKEWRTQENRRYRSYVKTKLRTNIDNWDNLQKYAGKYGNEWDSPRDGKGWVGDSKWRPCPHAYWWHGLMRMFCHDGKHFRCINHYKEMMRK